MREYTFSDIYVGQMESFSKEITSDMEDAFREITGDENPLHKEDVFAEETGKFKKHIAFGMLTASRLSTLAGVYLPGKYSLIHSIENLCFKVPVYAGDVLTVTGTVGLKHDGLKLICLKVKVINQEGRVVMTADMKILVQK